MLPKGIIFDLDDTIIQFDAIAKQTWLDACQYFTDRKRISDSSQLFESIERTRKWFWSDKKRHKVGRLDLDKARKVIINKALQELSISDEKLADLIVKKYSKDRVDNISFFPKAQETLITLNELGIKLVLITNGQANKQREKVNRFNLNKFFKAILIEGEIGFGKPEPKIYDKALIELDLKPESVWSIGDNLEWDVDGPQKKGVYGIWNDYKNKGLPRNSPYKPDRIINSIADLIE